MDRKFTFGMFAVLALALACFVPMTDMGTDGQIYHEGTNVFEVSTSETFEIKYTVEADPDDDTEKKLTYNAKVIDKSKNTMSGAVTSSTGTLVSGELYSITVKVPSTAGKYTLVVDYLVDGEKKATDEFAFSAVTAKTLTVNLKAEDVTLNLDSFGVFFVIDGEKMDDSYTTVTLDRDGTGSVSYDWIADPELGQHVFKVVAAGGIDVIQGLDEEHTFVVGVEDYSLVIALTVLVLIVLIIWAVRTYRKPIRNFGKPKARR